MLEKERLGWGAHARNGGMVIPELKAGPRDPPHELRRDGRPDVPRGQRGVRPRRVAHRRRDRLRLRRAPGSCTWRTPSATSTTCASSPKSTRRKARTSSSSTATSSPARSARPVPRRGPLRPHRRAAPRPLPCRPRPPHEGSRRTRARPLPGDASSRPRRGSRRDPAWRGQRQGRHRRDQCVRRRPAAGAAQAGAADRQLHRHHRAARCRRARRGQPAPSHVRRHQEPPLLLAHHARRPCALRWSAQPQPRIARRSARVPDHLDAAHPPATAERKITHQWSGHVAITLDRMPHAGQLRGAWYATGCNGSGVATNTWLGHRIAQAVLGEAEPPAVAGFATSRSRCIGRGGPTCPPSGAWYRWQDRPDVIRGPCAYGIIRVTQPSQTIPCRTVTPVAGCRRTSDGVRTGPRVRVRRVARGCTTGGRKGPMTATSPADQATAREPTAGTRSRSTTCRSSTTTTSRCATPTSRSRRASSSRCSGPRAAGRQRRCA